MIYLKDPWEEPINSYALEKQLRKELHKSHYLNKFSNCVKAIAKRYDNDDVIFEIREFGYALVHLTWAKQDSNKFPIYKLLPTEIDVQEKIEQDFLDT